ncbi:hypothetical protein [Chryseobacterium hagamense]|uniref:Uncharacterized protein n=1 Tax=Chryseobacterium hagamense TaxID=395935 RepID=A0A511YK63_9FLAO|nr:hypothetical protein [Chryseobacterium hagamense]GEN75589.1 hypothetical protein CHA01nite_13290 [Chryseobacterium hagamense]
MHNLDWDGMYSAVLYIIRNYPLTILLYCLVCFVAGLLISLMLTLIMRKYNAFYRTPKYYNWLVKLYIPAIFIINGLVSLQLGLFWGSYEALKKDSFSISSQIYSSGVGAVFKDQKAKAEFIGGVRTVVSEISRNNENTKIKITDLVRAYDTKYGIINQPKNRMASWLMDQYGDRINTMVVYGILNSIPNVEVTGDLSYREFDKITKQLLVLDPDDIEKSIVEKIRNFYLMILKSQFKTLAGSLMMLWFILMLIPWLEFWIYTYVTKRITKRNNQIK